MRKIVVVSTNNNPDYYFYSPYIYKAWKSYGWEVCTMITSDVSKDVIKSDYIITVPDIEGLRKETLAQASRLYASKFLPMDAMIMTSDMDLLPLQDYWKPEAGKITNYGHDLTDYSFYPMGYTAMLNGTWQEVMRLTDKPWEDLERDAKEIGVAYSPDWEAWWNHDWTLLTKRLQGYDVTKILRGRRAGSCFAFGRVDRGDSMQIPNEPLIDAHCENHNVKHPEKLAKFLNLFEQYHGKL